MNPIKEALSLTWNTPKLFSIVIFQILAVVPMFLSFFLLTAAALAIPVNIGAGVVIMAFALFFFLLLFFYQVFIKSLLYGTAHRLVRARNISFLEMFKGMRVVYWRLIGYGITVFILLIPTYILFYFGLFGGIDTITLQNTITAYHNKNIFHLLALAAGVVYAIFLYLATLWGVTALPEKGAFESLTESWELFTKRPGYTALTVLFLFALFTLAILVSITTLQLHFLWQLVGNIVAIIILIYATIFLFAMKRYITPKSHVEVFERAHVEHIVLSKKRKKTTRKKKGTKRKKSGTRAKSAKRPRK